MSPRQEEEFELILGNKQLLSLFFLVVVLFGVFFSFGYTVGYGRGENSRTREVAGAEPVEEPAKKVQLPDSLLQEPPKPTETAAVSKPELPRPITPPVTTTPAKTEPTPPPVTTTTPAKETPKPSPVVKESPKPAPVTPPPTKSTPPAKTSPPPAPAPAAAASGSYQLQISAVRVKKDAEVFIEQLKSKGHPALLSDQGDGWFRVIVGPFKSNEEATSYQQRLRTEGFQSIVRRR